MANSRAHDAMPAQMEKHHEIIRHGQDGSLMLATSGLTGRYWKGSVWYFTAEAAADADEAPSVQRCHAAHELENGICDLKILQFPKVVVALDSGSLQILELKESGAGDDSIVFNELFEATEHDDSLSSISIACDNEKIVSGSWDRCIKIWDVQTFVSTNTYKDAHGDLIWMVACHLQEADVFASCSDDNEVRLWDLRLPRPAMYLGDISYAASPTALAWKPNNPNLILIGTDVGDYHALDVRKNEFTCKNVKCHSRAFRSIEFSSATPNWFATCAEETSVRVFNMSADDPEQIYDDDTHEDFVRGLSWHPSSNKLYSCGWDSSIKSHSIETDMETNS